VSFSPLKIATQKRKVGRGWIWFFVALGLLTLAAIAVQIWYNPTVPLTPALLAEARAKWKERGPSDYDMDYIVKKIESTEHFHVRVRNGQAVSVVMNDNVDLESRLFRYYTMPALYEFIAEFMEQDTQPARPRVFTNVFFDPVDGHLIHYVRSVAVKLERQEISVQLTPVRVQPAAGPF
jgi:Family of unknown function (DUF6174)